MEALDADVARTYWSIIAQLAGLFLIPLVIEARRAAARWSNTSRHMRRAQGAFFYGSGVALGVLVAYSLLEMGSGESPSTWFRVFVASLFGVISLVLVFQLLPYAAAPFREDLEVLRRFLPGSTWRKNRRRIVKAERLFARQLRSLIEERDSVDQKLNEVEKRSKELRAIITHVRTSLPGAQVEEAIEQAILRMAVDEEIASKARAMASGDFGFLDDDVVRAIERARELIRSVDARIRDMEYRAEKFDQTRSEVSDIRHMSPEFKSAVETSILVLEADARDRVEEAKGLRIQVEGAFRAAKNAEAKLSDSLSPRSPDSLRDEGRG